MKQTIPLTLLLYSAVSLGCGGNGIKTYQVSGIVNWKNSPLLEGDIIFEDVDGAAHPAAGKIVNGKFAFKSTAGRKIVRIMANREKPGQEHIKAMGMREKEQYLSATYNRESLLREEVIADGQNTYRFDLN